MNSETNIPLRVAFFATVPERLYTKPSGRETHAAPWISLLADALSAEGVEVHVVTRGRADAPENRHFPPDSTGRCWHVWEAARKASNRNVLEDFRTLRSNLCSCARAAGADLVHGHGTEYVYARAASESGLPFVISLQACMRWLARVRKTRLLYWYAAFWEARTVRRSDTVICKNRFSAEWVRRLSPSTKIEVIPNVLGPAFRTLAAKETPPQGPVAFVGTVCRDKGTFDLVEALAACPDKKLRLVIVGTGTPADLKRLQELIARRSLGDRVELRGHVEPAVVAGIVRESRCLALPTHCDNSPNVVIEALAAGVPVLASRVGGIPEMIEDGVNGRLFAPGDIRTLADYLGSPVTDWVAPDRTRREAARIRLLERHAPGEVAARHIGIYRRILGAYRTT